MPARGRHRRPRPGPVSRVSRAVTAGGAGLAALPLAGAGAAYAAPEDAWERRAEYETAGRSPTGGGGAPQAAPAVPERPGEAAAEQAARERERAERDRAERAAAARAERSARATSYEVVGGDSLSSIARAHGVDGGWPALYERNRGVVGADPDLIFPGQRLSLESRTAPARERPAEPAQPQRPGKPQPEPEQDREADRESGRESGREADPERKDGPPAPRAGAQPKPQPEPAAREAVAPVAGAETGTPYHAAGSGWSSGYHTGVDFPVPTGTTVRAVSGGSVVSAGWAGAYGYQVVLRHDDGRYSQYAHLSAIAVSAGQRVNPGQRVGRSGSTGNSTGPHLHFEVRTGPGYGTDIDPLAYLRGLGVTL